MSREIRSGSGTSTEVGCGGSIVMMAIAFGIAVSLHACDDSGPNDSNSYRVRAVVDQIHNDSFHITDVTILDASASARARLEDGEDIHDNYKDLSCVGHETSDDFDKLRENGSLHEGSVVEVRATVGQSHYSCTPGESSGLSGPRSLLEELTIIPQ